VGKEEESHAGAMVDDDNAAMRRPEDGEPALPIRWVSKSRRRTGHALALVQGPAVKGIVQREKIRLPERARCGVDGPGRLVAQCTRRSASMPQSTPLGRLGAALRLDLRPGCGQPSNVMVALASAVAIAGALAVDALLVALGTMVFPATKGYSHFRFSDYAELTIIGVVIACLAWPVVTRITTAPRWLFIRLAVIVTLVLWLPDTWLLLRRQPVEAVAVLMTMHLAIAVVTYNAMVRIAPPRVVSSSDSRAGEPELGAEHERTWVVARSAWIAMAVAVALEFVVGLAALVLVPIGRPSGLIPRQGRLVYDVHALIGAGLLVGAVTLAIASRRAMRMVRISAVAGLVGVLLGGAGGLVANSHPLRLLGISLMFAGSMVAGFAYLVGVLEPTSRQDA
jgi:hypothetical protein